MDTKDVVTREQLRLSLLRYLAANATVYGCTVSLLQQFLRSEGMRTPPGEIQAELTYLMDKGFIAETMKAISPELQAYRITAQGRDFWAQTQGG